MELLQEKPIKAVGNKKSTIFFMDISHYLSKIESGKSEGNIKYDEGMASMNISVLTQSFDSLRKNKKGEKKGKLPEAVLDRLAFFTARRSFAASDQAMRGNF
jgi:hypothetical protein